MQNNIYKQFVTQYGIENVSTENDTGRYSKIDIVVQHGKTYTFYELKCYDSLQKCIREALSQLMEYAYFPDKNIANTLVIVSQNKVDDDTCQYLKKLRADFNLPIFYQQYNEEIGKLNMERC